MEQHLTSCNTSPAGAAPLTRFPNLLDQAQQLSSELIRTPVLENDTIENTLALIDRGVRAVTNACPPADMLDRALLLIVERHGVSSQ